jgi:hypothetical protein
MVAKGWEGSLAKQVGQFLAQVDFCGWVILSPSKIATACETLAKRLVARKKADCVTETPRAGQSPNWDKRAGKLPGGLVCLARHG